MAERPPATSPAPLRTGPHAAPIWWAVLGLAVGVSAASVLYAQSRRRSMPTPTEQFSPMPPVTAPFEIVDTPGSTFLLNKSTGQVWRLGFTEVSGDRYWFGTHVPVQQPSTFDEFQQGLRRRLKATQK